ncbi:MAG TPA: hypothetical protein VN688_12135 [Gemmataceae bacterium]|nr:hypothetical protein [Gemmataceae bacterium]
MLRRLLRLIAPLLLLALCTPVVQAQATPAEPEKSERSTSALPYAVAILYTMLVLMIVCMPSRKA